MDKLFNQRQWAKRQQIEVLQAQRLQLIAALIVPGASLAFIRNQIKQIDLMITTLSDEYKQARSE